MCNCYYCTKNIKGVKRWIKEWESELERLKVKGITSGRLCSDNDDEKDFAICKTEISYALYWIKEIEKEKQSMIERLANKYNCVLYKEKEGKRNKVIGISHLDKYIYIEEEGDIAVKIKFEVISCRTEKAERIIEELKNLIEKII